MTGVNWQHDPSPHFIVLLSSLTNSGQHLDAGLQIGLRNVGEQFVPKIVGCPANLCNHTLGALGQQHHFATAIAWRTVSGNPAFFLQPV
jgi:hypothetical protein